MAVRRPSQKVRNLGIFTGIAAALLAIVVGAGWVDFSGAEESHNRAVSIADLKDHRGASEGDRVTLAAYVNEIVADGVLSLGASLGDHDIIVALADAETTGDVSPGDTVTVNGELAGWTSSAATRSFTPPTYVKLSERFGGTSLIVEAQREVH